MTKSSNGKLWSKKCNIWLWGRHMGIHEFGVSCYEFLVLSVICSQFQRKEFGFK